MKSDRQLKHDVNAELEWDPAIDAAHVSVAVEDGGGVISGHWRSRAETCAVEPAVQRVADLRAIAVEADVERGPQPQRSDAAIAAAIETALRRRARIPADRIRVRAESAVATLRGKVSCWPEREAVQAAAWLAPGISRVINELQIEP